MGHGSASIQRKVPRPARVHVQWAAVLFIRAMLDGGDLHVAKRVAAAIDPGALVRPPCNVIR